jgi:hypothetical protein
MYFCYIWAWVSFLDGEARGDHRDSGIYGNGQRRPKLEAAEHG